MRSTRERACEGESMRGLGQLGVCDEEIMRGEREGKGVEWSPLAGASSCAECIAGTFSKSTGAGSGVLCDSCVHAIASIASIASLLPWRVLCPRNAYDRVRAGNTIPSCFLAIPTVKTHKIVL